MVLHLSSGSLQLSISMHLLILFYWFHHNINYHLAYLIVIYCQHYLVFSQKFLLTDFKRNKNSQQWSTLMVWFIPLCLGFFTTSPVFWKLWSSFSNHEELWQLTPYYPKTFLINILMKTHQLQSEVLLEWFSYSLLLSISVHLLLLYHWSYLPICFWNKNKVILIIFSWIFFELISKPSD